MVMTTDGYVVSPLFFPGGDIGTLAVHGTINDVAMAGARPLYLSASFIIEEGFRARRSRSASPTAWGEASRAAGVPIITGDTKVVERGKADGVFVSTTGVGVVPPGLASVERPRAARRCRAAVGNDRRSRRRGDVEAREPRIRDRDPVRQRGAAWPRRRNGGGLRPASARDARPDARRARGGRSTNSRTPRASASRSKRPRSPCAAEVAAACEFLGLDPLNVANEGKLIAIVAPEAAEALLAVMRAHPLGRDAAIIGRAVEDTNRFVEMRTAFGGGRIVDWLAGEQLPRIC